MNLEWNVFYYNTNKNKIEQFNIFNHSGFAGEVSKYLSKCNDRILFEANIKLSLMYYFWSRCEYEIIITSFPTYITIDELERLNDYRVSHKGKYEKDLMRISANLDTEIKIDIYSQVMLNWDKFINYLWNF